MEKSNVEILYDTLESMQSKIVELEKVIKMHKSFIDSIYIRLQKLELKSGNSDGCGH